MRIKSIKKVDRIIEKSEKDIDLNDFSLRPKSLDMYVGQENLKKHLSVSIASAKIRKTSLEHLLFYWPPWLWKTTISNIISYEMWTNLKITSWPAIEKQADIVSILSNLEENEILFIDEIHRLKPQIEEVLYTAMEDFVIDIIVWKWPWSQSVRIPISKFTLIWATTKLSSVAGPLRDRFWNILKLDFYTNDELFFILKRNKDILWIDLKDNVLFEIAKRSRWTPRVANRILKILRDYFVVWKDINNDYENIFLELWIDDLGLDYLDRKYLETINNNFSWWPVWLTTLASSVWEEEQTLEDIVEPYLLQIWFLEKTSRWRKITDKAILHLNK